MKFTLRNSSLIIRKTYQKQVQNIKNSSMKSFAIYRRTWLFSFGAGEGELENVYSSSLSQLKEIKFKYYRQFGTNKSKC